MNFNITESFSDKCMIKLTESSISYTHCHALDAKLNPEMMIKISSCLNNLFTHQAQDTTSQEAKEALGKFAKRDIKLINKYLKLQLSTLEIKDKNLPLEPMPFPFEHQMTPSILSKEDKLKAKSVILEKLSVIEKKLQTISHKPLLKDPSIVKMADANLSVEKEKVQENSKKRKREEKTIKDIESNSKTEEVKELDSERKLTFTHLHKPRMSPYEKFNMLPISFNRSTNQVTVIHPHTNSGRKMRGFTVEQLSKRQNDVSACRKRTRLTVKL